MSHILMPREIKPRHHVGSKARQLALLDRYGLPIPKWAVLIPEAFFDSLDPAQLDALSAATTSKERHAVLNQFVFHPDILDELEYVLMKLSPEGEMLAIRTSPVDGEHTGPAMVKSHATSFLAVPPEKEMVVRYILGVWRAAFEQRGDGDVENTGDEGQDRISDIKIPAVMIQRMIFSDVSGFAQGVEPETGMADITVILSAYGVGLDSDASERDEFRLNGMGELVSKLIGSKAIAYRVNPQQSLGGVVEEPVSTTRASAASLKARQLVAIQKLTRMAAKRLGAPQDIEWAFEGKNLYLLESHRNLTPQIETGKVTRPGPLTYLRRLKSYFHASE